MFEFLYALIGSEFFHGNNIYVIALMIVLLINRKFIIRIDKMWLLLAVTGITYAVIYQYNMGTMGLATIMTRIISPLLLYLVGLNTVCYMSSKIKTYWLIISFASFAHCFANTIKNRSINILSIEGRMLSDIYGGEITATLQNLGFIFVCGLLFYACFVERKKYIRIAIIAAVICSAIGSVLTASRTVLYFIVVCFCFSLILFLKLNSNKRKKTNILAMIIFAVIVMISAVWVNAFGINDRLMSTALGIRLNVNGTSGVFDNLRWEYARSIIEMIPLYPMGNIPYPHYAHNFWLDVAKETGIIPFVGYVLFYVISVVHIVRSIKNKVFDDEMKQFLIPFLLAFSVALFTEPIMQGTPFIFSLFALYVGMISGYTSKKKFENYE